MRLSSMALSSNISISRSASIISWVSHFYSGSSLWAGAACCWGSGVRKCGDDLDVWCLGDWEELKGSALKSLWISWRYCWLLPSFSFRADFYLFDLDLKLVGLWISYVRLKTGLKSFLNAVPISFKQVAKSWDDIKTDENRSKMQCENTFLSKESGAEFCFRLLHLAKTRNKFFLTNSLF